MINRTRRVLVDEAEVERVRKTVLQLLQQSLENRLDAPKPPSQRPPSTRTRQLKMHRMVQPRPSVVISSLRETLLRVIGPRIARYAYKFKNTDLY